jgi:hypothetical protein
LSDEHGNAALQVRRRGFVAKNTVVPKPEPPPSFDEQLELDLKKHGTVRCALCDWSMTGPMAEAIEAQVAHREQHEVQSHPEVRRRSAMVKRDRARREAKRTGRAAPADDLCVAEEQALAAERERKREADRRDAARAARRANPSDVAARRREWTERIRAMPRREDGTCACGCGADVKGTSAFVRGHHNRLWKRENSAAA